MAEAFHSNLKKNKEASSYLYKRGVLDNDIEKWEIGWAPGDWNFYKQFTSHFNINEIIASGIIASTNGRYYDRFRNRIIFPIKNENGDVLGFTGRAINEYEDDIKVAKYLNSPASELFDKSSILFGINHAVPSIKKNKCVILVEGQFDVVTAHRCGITNVVACSGTSLTANHLTFIKKYTKNVVICFDDDIAGRNAAIKACILGISVGMNVDILNIKGGDPDEVLRSNPLYLEDINAIPRNKYVSDIFMKEMDVSLLIKYLEGAKTSDQNVFLLELEKCTY